MSDKLIEEVSDDFYIETEGHPDCCGRSHIYGFADKGALQHGHGFHFPLTDKGRKALRKAVKNALGEAASENLSGWHNPNRRKYGHVVEVTLTDSQAEIWEEALLYYGFKQVARWRNHKSGNFVRSYFNNIGRSEVRRKLR